MLRLAGATAATSYVGCFMSEKLTADAGSLLGGLLLVVTDPRADCSPVIEAFYVKLPTIVL